MRMGLGNFTNTFISQIDNPDCSMLAGGLVGEVFVFRIIFYLVVIGFLYRIIMNLAIEPITNWIKSKITTFVNHLKNKQSSIKQNDKFTK